MEPMSDDVLALLGEAPLSVGALGLALVDRLGGDLGPDDAPVGQRLAVAGLSLSALQRTVDRLVGDGVVTELRGKDLWERGIPTAGTKAMGRYYLVTP